MIKFLGRVSLTMGLEVSFLSMITKLVGSILVGRKKLPKSFSVVCISLPCSRRLICIIRFTLNVNGLGESI